MTEHRPVMLAEVLEVLAPADGNVVVDATFGRGGVTAALARAARCAVWALDRDPEAVAAGAALEAEFSGRVVVIRARFGDMEDALAERGVTKVDGVAFDLGVSSPQLDDPARGFSFADGPLDMRMDPSGDTAADVVNTLEETELSRIIFELGEERYARRVAKAILEARRRAPITRTAELAALIAKVVPPERRDSGVSIHPATRTFQALRMHVNDEIGELRRGLAAAERLLAPDGRLAVIAFHSIEDREVKRFLTLRSDRAPAPSRHLPAMAPREPSFRLIERGVRRPSDAEVAMNPRARSARLRAAVRTPAAAWEEAA